MSVKFSITISIVLLWIKWCESGVALSPDYLISLRDSNNLSSQCLQQIEHLDQLTVLKMFDASSKIPSGLLNGNFFDLGNFDECLGINSDSAVGPIRGKYCLGTIPFNSGQQEQFDKLLTLRRNFAIHPQPRMLGMSPDSVGIHTALCVPHGCSAAEISSLSTYTENFCYSQQDVVNYSDGFYATIIIISLFLLIMAVSTTYDIVLVQRGQKSKHEIFIAFSALSNGRKLFTSTTNADQLLCLNGIKAISMMWVILGHCYSSAIASPLLNALDASQFQSATENMFMTSATLSVDTFFVVGGLVTAYAFLKSHDKGIKFNVPLYYLHRYLRLTPAFAIVLLVNLYIVNYLGSGPLWGSLYQTLVEPCQTGWWGTIFYIQNYQQIYCVAQSWYLSVDMQLFVLSPLVLLPMVRWPKYTMYCLGLLTIIGIIVPFTVGYVHELSATGVDSLKYMHLYYMQTYARFAPYVIGIILGYYLYKFKRSGQASPLSRVVVCLLWAVGLGGLLACIYAPHEADHTLLASSFMLGFQRPAWSVALSIVIYLCITGHGSFVDRFLSLPIFQFLTKVSYSMYLIHFLVINVKTASLRTELKFSNIEMMMQFWGIFMYTLALSLVLCLTFESPIIIIEKLLFGREKRQATSEKPQV